MNKYKIMLYGINRYNNLKKLLSDHINIYDVKIDSKKIYIIIDEYNYRELKNIRHKVIDTYGISKIKLILRKDYILIISFLIASMFLLFLSSLILKIEVNHSNKKVQNIILRDLKSNGISKYKFKVSFKKLEKIKQKIKEKERNLIDYIEIKNIGSKYIVDIEMRKEKKEEANNSPRHLISRYDAIIIKIDADEGEVVKKKLDYVKRGDILISGIIHNKEKEVKKVRSRGIVFGEVWYKVEVELPKKYEEVKITNKKHKIVGLKFLNKYLNFRKYKTSYIRSKTTLYKNKLLPISLVLLEEVKTLKTKKIYTDNKAKEDALKIATKKIKNTLKKDEKILKKESLKISVKDSKIIVDVFFKIQKNITGYILIDDVKLGEGDKDANTSN